MARALAEESIQEAAKYRKISFEEFLRWDSGEGAHEWVDGRIIEMPPVSDRHAEIVTFLFKLLGIATEIKELGIIRGEPFVMRATTKGPGRSPDLMFISNMNLSRIQELYLLGPADIAIEVVSPGSHKTDYFAKRDEYERSGIPEYWIIDPDGNKTTFLVLDESGRYVDAELIDGRYISKLLGGLSIDSLWFLIDPMPSTHSILKEWGIL